MHTHICMYIHTHTHTFVHTHTGTGSIYIDMLVCACPQHTQECTIIFISYMQYCISYSLYTGLHVQCVVVCVWFYCCLVLQGLAVRRVPILCTKQENLCSHWLWWRRTQPSPSLPCTFTSYDCYATYTATTHCCIQTTAAAVLLSSLHTWSHLQRDWNQSFCHIDHDFNTKDFLQLHELSMYAIK